jgi:cytochrome P450
MSPAFSTMNLQKTTLGILKDKTVAFVSKLQDLSSDAENACIDMKELNVSIIFEVLAESLFDLRLDDDLDGFDCEAFLTAQNSTLREAMRRTNIPFRKFMFWSKEKQFSEKSEAVLKDLGATVLRKYREKQLQKTAEEKSEEGASIIGHLISHDYPSDEHRIADLIVFLIAGHETTAHSLSFFLYCIATNDAAREKLQQELDDALPRLSDTPTAAELASVTPSAISQLEYFSWCLKESQRLYPVAPVIGRQLQQEISHNGFVLPKNSIVACHLYGAGRQRWIEDADQFKPERWSKAHPQYEQLRQIPTLFSM